jgi:hypothetical protein
MTAAVPPVACDSQRDVRETFRSCIQALLKHLETNPSQEYMISSLLSMFRFQKRRMYDVTCVFTVIGACAKKSVDVMRWFGLSKVPSALRRMQFEHGVDLPGLPLDAIIGSSDLVSICSLTMRFLLCFLSLRIATLDVREVSRYLSRRCGRGKSLLCKLYQIAQILEAVGVLSRSRTPGPVTLVDRYFVPVDVSLHPVSPWSVEGLLNHVSPIEEQVIVARRQELFAYSAKETTVESQPD